MDYQLGLLGNIVIRGTIEAMTGLHIGASVDTVEIGGIDSPVIKHPKTGEPYIPGSSLKGKMRSFMEKITFADDKEFKFNRNSGTARNAIWQHVCDDVNSSYMKKESKTGSGAKSCPVCRVYGSTGQNEGANHPARIVVRDSILTEEEIIKQDNLYVFEAKMENAIDRMTAAAHPRTFERVPQGAKFGFEIVYKVQGEFETNNNDHKIKSTEISQITKDIQNIFEVLSLIEKDGLGGSISRGYGQVKFTPDEKVCKYYKVGGGEKPYLSDIGTDLEVLRQHDFKHLEDLISGNGQ